MVNKRPSVHKMTFKELFHHAVNNPLSKDRKIVTKKLISLLDKKHEGLSFRIRYGKPGNEEENHYYDLDKIDSSELEKDIFKVAELTQHPDFPRELLPETENFLKKHMRLLRDKAYQIGDYDALKRMAYNENLPLFNRHSVMLSLTFILGYIPIIEMSYGKRDKSDVGKYETKYLQELRKELRKNMRGFRTDVIKDINLRINAIANSRRSVKNKKIGSK